eukprot:Seg977.5 transcript_id=Seg977.5/GoldUCD/mRNA.D3Y31 product="Universal stress protein YxiE" protein_id=Seg977.5/GoldUCD/D3Y31
MASGEKEARTILIPVDGSEHSDRAFNWYVNHLHREGDHVGVVNIVEPPKVPASFMVMGPLVTPDEWHRQLKANVEKAKEVGENYKKMCDKAGIKCSVYVEGTEDSPGEKICQMAKEKNVSGVVMGSRGLNFLRRTFLGSVSSYVVNHANVPVTVTPPKEGGEQTPK